MSRTRQDRRHARPRQRREQDQRSDRRAAPTRPHPPMAQQSRPRQVLRRLQQNDRISVCVAHDAGLPQARGVRHGGQAEALQALKDGQRAGKHRARPHGEHRRDTQDAGQSDEDRERRRLCAAVGLPGG